MARDSEYHDNTKKPCRMTILSIAVAVTSSSFSALYLLEVSETGHARNHGIQASWKVRDKLVELEKREDSLNGFGWVLAVAHTHMNAHRVQFTNQIKPTVTHAFNKVTPRTATPARGQHSVPHVPLLGAERDVVQNRRFKDQRFCGNLVHVVN